ncbi:MAG: site-specific integrase [Actinomycetota bacterium]|nr:site-specific integrase [Actinomycetota bacterium]
MSSNPASPDLAALLPSWVISLQADGRSPQTVESYVMGVRRFLAWCAEQGVSAVLDRRTVNGFVAGLRAGGAAPATRSMSANSVGNPG